MREKEESSQGRRDVAKLLFLAVIVTGSAAIFALNPTLSTPTLLAIVSSMLLSPWVAALERRGVSRAGSIGAVFGMVATCLGLLSLWAARAMEAQWNSFRERAPEHFAAAMNDLRKLEEAAKAKYPALSSTNATDSLVAWGQDTGRWFAENGGAMVGSALTLVLLVPILTFVLLNDGRTMRRKLFELVPNRFFESFFLVASQITKGISDYLRAKLVEAFLVALLTTAGLMLVGAPYAIVLGVVAGITNILPYIGPVIGAVPALMVVLFDPASHGLIVPVSIVYIVANLIDMVVIFPIVVANLVNLHPILLIAVVAIGQQYYGLVGMLISIPIATACKVILSEIYSIIYHHHSVTPSSGVNGMTTQD
jgi:putative permease